MLANIPKNIRDKNRKYCQLDRVCSVRDAVFKVDVLVLGNRGRDRLEGSGCSFIVRQAVYSYSSYFAHLFERLPSSLPGKKFWSLLSLRVIMNARARFASL